MHTLETSVYIPVPAAEPLVGALRKRWDPTAAFGIPAHITLVYPFVDHEVLTRDVLDELATIVGSMPRFDLRLGATGRFERTSYLVPEPDAPIHALAMALTDRWPELPPYGGRHPEFIPHLTMADDVPEHVIATIERTVEGKLPIHASADVVHIAAKTNRRWEVVAVATLA